MKNNYPLFDEKSIKEEYALRINNILIENSVNWIAIPASISPQILVKPKNDLNLYNFPNVSRIKVYTEGGIAGLAIRGLSSMQNSDSKKVLEKRGYLYEYPIDSDGSCRLIKPLEDLEELAKELKDLESILKKK